jgi:hypothetical protein
MVKMALRSVPGEAIAATDIEAVQIIIRSPSDQRKRIAPLWSQPENLGAQGATKSAIGGRADVLAIWPKLRFLANSGRS